MTRKLNFFEHTIDKIGVGLSTACLVHCLLLPILLATIPFISFLSIIKTPVAEAIMIIFAIINAIVAIMTSSKKHGNLFVPTLFISGMMLLVLNFIAHNFIQTNEYIITIGAFMIGIGHIWNKRLCQSCSKCKNQHE
jgi:hypothetical protein